MKDKDNQPGLKPLRIESFAQLTALFEAPVYCYFKIEGPEGEQLIELPCLRLSEEMRDRVSVLLRKATPPLRTATGRGTTEAKFDYDDKAYQAEAEKNEKIARAVILYWGCPALAAQSPGLVTDDEIYSFVRALKWPDTIKELIALTIQKGGVDRAERANFYSAAGSAS